ncbi:MAG: DegT/DnrJ/EryC1/StrS family aminotransferase [Syntrophobacteraceae bacterium]
MDLIIPLFSAEAANAGVDLQAPVRRVMGSNWYILGSEVAAFEREFAEYCGVGHCISVANGTDALELALRAVNVGPGERVLLAANAGFYGSTAVHSIGAVPRYVEIDNFSLTLSVEGLRHALKEGAKTIIATHLFGQLAQIEAIVETASRYGVPVIEDCAQAHGARINGKLAGSFGSIGCFSFYPTKNLGALGDGGAIVSSDESLAARLKQLRQYGWGSKYNVKVPGGRNSRMDELQAAILREKLPFLDRWNTERRAIARRYNDAFSAMQVTCPCSLGEDYVAHLYVLRLTARDNFRQFLSDRGVSTEVHYPIPDHMQSAYLSRQGQGDLPLTEQACAHVVSLPCYPGLETDKIERVIDIVRLYFEQAGV